MRKVNVIKKLVNYGIILIGFNLFVGCDYSPYEPIEIDVVDSHEELSPVIF